MLFQRTKIRRHTRTREAEQATDWLAKVAETRADAATAPTRLDTPPPLLPQPRYAHLQRAPFGRRSAPRRRVIELAPDQTATQEIPRIPAGPALTPVRPPLPLPTRRAPQPAATALTPVADSQARRGATWTVTIPPPPAPLSYAERLAAVFDQADRRLTSMSGWIFNRTADDILVTKTRFAGLKSRFADLLGAPLELTGASR
jgi:hypothetical protein